MKADGGLRKVAFLGNYLPRQCGIATFTKDLCEAVQGNLPESECFAVALNDRAAGYEYPSKVRFEIAMEAREQYDLAADYLNVSQADVVCVQHEYGIYGGKMGSYLMPLLKQLRARVVTTLHTVLAEPSPKEKEVLLAIALLSDRLVVMSQRANTFLREIYGVPQSQIRMIHHGIPDVPFVDPNYYKNKLGAEGRRLILTFGLLGPDKGIEYAIQALPKVVEQHPDVLYIVLGATHPHVKREKGEQYRMHLQTEVRRLHLEKHVVFHNRFVEMDQLCEYLCSADLYITPYLNPAQITSGTLAYAMGTGKAVVSTPYWYAEDMLAEGRGRLVPFRNPDALAEQLIDLLTNETERHAMRRAAYDYGRSMVWPSVGAEYVNLFREVTGSRIASHRLEPVREPALTRVGDLPGLNPNHLVNLTDSVGILQHAKFSVPDREHGYSTDDQARALVVALTAPTYCPEGANWDGLASRYLSYLLYAFDPATARFNNFVNYEHQWQRHVATEDVHARAVWALAHTVSHAKDEGKRALATELLELATAPARSFQSPRARALTILGIQVYLRRYGGASRFLRERRELAQLLFDQCQSNKSEDWLWPEDQLTYGNARIPHALIEAGISLPNDDMFDAGIQMLDWLDRIQTSDAGCFTPIGTKGWYTRGGDQARFDQQPVEAQTMLDACLAAYRGTHDERWIRAGQKSFDWFLGHNDLQIALYDYTTGGCFDGLHPDRVNRNQGAESTVCWIQSLILMHELHDEISAFVPASVRASTEARPTGQ